METQVCKCCKQAKTLDLYKLYALTYKTCTPCREHNKEKQARFREKKKAKLNEDQQNTAVTEVITPAPTPLPELPPQPTTKVCLDCCEIKQIDQFISRSTRFKGICDRCLTCRDKMVAYKRQHAEDIRVKRKVYLKETKEHVQQRYKKYCENNRKKFCEYQAKYREKPEFRVKCAAAGRLRELLVSKNHATKDYLGVPLNLIREWLEFNFTENINWDNYGKYWHVDHVIPCKLWNLLEETEAMQCFSWMNVIPKERCHNIGKQSRLVPHEIIRQEFTVKKFAAEKHPELIPSINEYFKAYAIKFKSLQRQHLQIVRETP